MLISNGHVLTYISSHRGYFSVVHLWRFFWSKNKKPLAWNGGSRITIPCQINHFQKVGHKLFDFSWLQLSVVKFIGIQLIDFVLVGNMAEGTEFRDTACHCEFSYFINFSQAKL